MQNTSIIAQKDHIFYESCYAFQSPDNQQGGSMIDHSKLEENSQNFYNSGANKRKQLFNDDNSEIYNIKDRKDDDLQSIQIPNKGDYNSTRQDNTYPESKFLKSEAFTITSPNRKSLIGTQTKLNDQLSVDYNRLSFKQINTKIGEDFFSPNQFRRESCKLRSDSYCFRGKKDDQSNSNIIQLGLNGSNVQGYSNQNLSQFNINKDSQNNINNGSGINYTMAQSTNNLNNSIGNEIYKHMKKMNNVMQFFQKMCQLSLTYNTKQLKERHYQLINDLSYFCNNNCKQQKQSSKGNLASNDSKLNFINIIVQLLICIPVLNPENLYCIIWDIIYGLSVLIYLFFIPMHLSFDIQCLPLTFTIIGLQVCNMLLSLAKGYYQQGHLILDRKKIFIHYIKQNLIIDLVIIFILFYYHNLCWIFFVNILKIKEIVLRADNYFQFVKKFPTFYEITNLMISILLIGQITGCGFHLIAQKEHDSHPNTKTWLQISNINIEDNWFDKYIACEYFAFITMITVGYGDIYPTTTVERVYVIFMTLVSSAVFGYVMNTIGSIFKHRAEMQQNIQMRKQDITTYMNDRNIDRSIQIQQVLFEDNWLNPSYQYIKILKYLDYQNSLEKKNNQTLEILFKDIPKNLTSEIYQKYFGSYLLNNKILSLNFSKESLIELSLTIKEKLLSPNEFLIQKGNQEQKVYFLQYGSLDIIIDTPQKKQILFDQINTIGECIGLRNAFNEDEYSYSIKSSENQSTQLFYFEMKDFKEILSKYSRDYEKYCEIKDEVIFNQFQLDTKCISCERYNHVVQDCPLINHNVSKPKTILRLNHTVYQERTENYKRRSRNQCFGNFKAHAELTRVKAKQFRLKMSMMFFPEYEQYINQIMLYDDEKFAIELPGFTLRDGTITMFDEDDQEEDEEGQFDFNNVLKNFNNVHHGQNIRKSSEPSIQSYMDQVQQQNTIPLVNSQLNFNEVIQIPQQTTTHLNPPIFQASSQKKIPSFINSFNPLSENIAESNNIQKDSIRELSSKSLISGKIERGDSFQNIKKPTNIIHSYSNQNPNSNLPVRQKNMRKQTQKYGQGHQNPEQEETNQDCRLFFLKNFEVLKNYVKYYPKGNSDIIIKKYNTIQSQKKIFMLKSNKNPLNTPKKRLLVARRSIIPSMFKCMVN